MYLLSAAAAAVAAVGWCSDGKKARDDGGREGGRGEKEEKHE